MPLFDLTWKGLEKDLYSSCSGKRSDAESSKTVKSGSVPYPAVQESPSQMTLHGSLSHGLSFGVITLSLTSRVTSCLLQCSFELRESDFILSIDSEKQLTLPKSI